MRTLRRGISRGARGVVSPKQAYHFARQDADALARDNDPTEVQRVCRRNGHWRLDAIRKRSADESERLKGLRQGELLPNKPVNKSSTSNLSARLHSPQRAEEVSPRRSTCLSDDEVTEDNTPASQKLPRKQLDPRSIVGLCRDAVALFDASQQRPAARAVSGARRLVASLAPPALRVDERAQAVKPISRHEPGRHKLPETVFDFAWESSSSTHEIAQKRSPTFPKLGEHLTRRVREGIGQFVVTTSAKQPIGVLS